MISSTLAPSLQSGAGSTPDSGLWQEQETDDIKTHELPRLAGVNKGLLTDVPDDDHAETTLKSLSSVLYKLQNQQLRNAVMQDCNSKQ